MCLPARNGLKSALFPKSGRDQRDSKIGNYYIALPLQQYNQSVVFVVIFVVVFVVVFVIFWYKMVYVPVSEMTPWIQFSLIPRPHPGLVNQVEFLACSCDSVTWQRSKKKLCQT